MTYFGLFGALGKELQILLKWVVCCCSWGIGREGFAGLRAATASIHPETAVQRGASLL